MLLLYQTPISIGGGGLAVAPPVVETHRLIHPQSLLKAGWPIWSSLLQHASAVPDADFNRRRRRKRYEHHTVNAIGTAAGRQSSARHGPLLLTGTPSLAR